MGFWSIIFGDDSVESETVPGGTNTERTTSSAKPTVRRRTETNGSTRIIIQTNGGNYNEYIAGDYIQGQVIR